MITALIYVTLVELGILIGMVGTRCWCCQSVERLTRDLEAAERMAEGLEIRAVAAEVALAAERGSYV